MEAISTIAIVAVLVAVSAPAITSGIGGYASAATRAEIGASLSCALDRILTEVHDIPLTTGATSADPAIDAVTPTSLTWSTNSSLSLSGNELRLVKAGGTARALLRDVSAFSIEAYDQGNNAMASSLSGAACDGIRRLRFTIAITKGGITETLRTKIFLRCTMAGAEP